MAKGKKGGFKDTDIDYMIYALLKQVIAKSKIDPNLVEDVCLGNVSTSPESAQQTKKMKLMNIIM